MGTINQPTPSHPGSPQADQQPLQPGDVQRSQSNSTDIKRSNPQSPDDQDERSKERK